MSKSNKFLLAIGILLSTSIGATVLADQEEPRPYPTPSPNPCSFVGACGSPFMPGPPGIEGEVSVNVETSMQPTALTISTIEVTTAPVVVNVRESNTPSVTVTVGR